METLLIDVPYKVKHPKNIETYRADFFTLKGYNDERGYKMYGVNCNIQKGFYTDIAPTAYQKFLELENQIQYIPEKPQPREIWINEYPENKTANIFWDTKEEAVSKLLNYSTPIRTIKFREVLDNEQ